MSKKKLSTRPDSCAEAWLNQQIYYQPPILTLALLKPLDLQEHTVPHLKDLIHICLEPEVQG